jgi:5,10-methenyltetrahydromethanopterin hydrogenase
VNLYLISHTVKAKDCYTHAVVVAESEDDARRINPAHYIWLWVNADDVDVKFIGTAADDLQEGSVVCKTRAYHV